MDTDINIRSPAIRNDGGFFVGLINRISVGILIRIYNVTAE
jgi:hypothetical protein